MPKFKSVSEAYAHLLKPGEFAYTVRPPGNRVLVFFSRALSAQLFDTLEGPGRWYSWSIYKNSVYLEPADLSLEFEVPKLRQMLNALDVDHEHADGRLELAELLWHKLQAIGQHVTRFAPQQANHSAQSDKYRWDLTKLKLEWTEVKLPKQARNIIAEVIDAEVSAYTVKEMDDFCRHINARGKLKTKQDPFRIFRYYAPVYYDHGWLQYPTRKVDGDGE